MGVVRGSPCSGALLVTHEAFPEADADGAPAAESLLAAAAWKQGRWGRRGRRVRRAGADGSAIAKVGRAIFEGDTLGRTSFVRLGRGRRLQGEVGEGKW